MKTENTSAIFRPSGGWVDCYLTDWGFSVTCTSGKPRTVDRNSWKRQHIALDV